MKTILSLLILASINAKAVEYVCWQTRDLQGLAFESQALNCPDGKKEKGRVAETGGIQKKTVCFVPALCLALTPNVIKILQDRTGKPLEEIKKLDGKSVHTALVNTPYMGRASTVICEGSGKVKTNDFNMLTLDEAKCPSLTACANVEEIFYNQSVTPPIPSDIPPDPLTNASPGKSAPSEVKR